MFDTARNALHELPPVPVLVAIVAVLLIIGIVVFDVNFLSFVATQ